MKPLFKTSAALGLFGPRFVNPLLVVVGPVITVGPVVVAGPVITAGLIVVVGLVIAVRLVVVVGHLLFNTTNNKFDKQAEHPINKCSKCIRNHGYLACRNSLCH